jgi:hypothetical protein
MMEAIAAPIASFLPLNCARCTETGPLSVKERCVRFFRRYDEIMSVERER